MIGIDIVSIERFSRCISGEYGNSLLEKIFTVEELRSLVHGPVSRRAERLAGRFAVKEAIIKASGGGLGIGDLTRIEIVNDAKGSLHVTIRDSSRPAGEYEISLSHDGGFAVGVAIRN